jgi:hypothetical protein
MTCVARAPDSSQRFATLLGQPCQRVLAEESALSDGDLMRESAGAVRPMTAAYGLIGIDADVCPA